MCAEEPAEDRRAGECDMASPGGSLLSSHSTRPPKAIVMVFLALAHVASAQTAGDCAWSTAMQIVQLDSEGAQYKLKAFDPVTTSYSTIHCFPADHTTVNAIGYNVVDHKGSHTFSQAHDPPISPSGVHAVASCGTQGMGGSP